MSINYFVSGVISNGTPTLVAFMTFCVVFLLQSFYKEYLQKKGGSNVANAEVLSLLGLTVAKYAAGVTTLVLGVVMFATISPV